MFINSRPLLGCGRWAAATAFLSISAFAIGTYSEVARAADQLQIQTIALLGSPLNSVRVPFVSLCVRFGLMCLIIYLGFVILKAVKQETVRN
jgi:hypothetical protein